MLGQEPMACFWHGPIVYYTWLTSGSLPTGIFPLLDERVLVPGKGQVGLNLRDNPRSWMEVLAIEGLVYEIHGYLQEDLRAMKASSLVCKPVPIPWVLPLTVSSPYINVSHPTPNRYVRDRTIAAFPRAPPLHTSTTRWRRLCAWIAISTC